MFFGAAMAVCILKGVTAQAQTANSYFIDTINTGDILRSVVAFCRVNVNRYPFVKGAPDLPINDFGNLFGAGGLMNSFFKQYLEPSVDKSTSPWSWHQNTELARNVSPEFLRAFQRADEINRAFFPNGGGQPSILLYVKPSFLNVPGAVARLEVAGKVVDSPALRPSGPPDAPQLQSSIISPVQVQWPGAPLSQIVVAFGSQQSEFIHFAGQWSVFHLLEAGGLSVQGVNATVRYVVGPLELHYDITSASSLNPLNLAALREFKCPTQPGSN
jgi:type VI secretion system protein ImpL